MDEQVTGMPKSVNWIRDLVYFSLSIIALASLLLFIFGFMLMQGYYSGAGISWNGEHSKEQTIFLGFFSFISLFPEALDAFLAPFYNWKMYVFWLFCGIVGILIGKYGNQSLNDKVDRFTGFKAAAFLLVPVILFVIALNSHELGKEMAIEAIQKFIAIGCESKDDGWNQCHQVWHNQDLIHEGYLLSKAGTSLVMYVREQKAIEYITMPEGAVLRRQYKPHQETSETD